MMKNDDFTDPPLELQERRQHFAQTLIQGWTLPKCLQALADQAPPEAAASHLGQEQAEWVDLYLHRAMAWLREFQEFWETRPKA